jgi:hypothetical protein
MGCSGHIKFGVSHSPKRRQSGLQTAVPFEVRLISQTAPMEREMAFALEQTVHGALAKYHARGEWYTSTPKTLAVAKLLKEKPPIDLLELFEGWAEEAARQTVKDLRSQSISARLY